MKQYFFFFITACLIACTGHKVQAQASMETFGHNRIQNKKFDWRFFETKHFKIYFYSWRGRTLARYVAELSEKDVSAIEQSIGHFFTKKVTIILYSSYDDYIQTNIGLSSDMQMQSNNPAGTFHLIGNKLVVYFDGVHSDLRQQIRKGFATVIMEHLMFGNNFRQMMRNAVLLDIPDWVSKGFVNYLVSGWSPTFNNDFKNYIIKDSLGKKIYFNDLLQQHPKVAGAAFWKYIATKYGDNKVRNLLFLLQLKGNINKAVKIGLNQKVGTTFDSLMAFYYRTYKAEKHKFVTLDTADALIKIPHIYQDATIRNIAVSPHGHDVAYVVWRHGQYQVIIQRTDEENGTIKQKRSTLLLGGVKDFNASAAPNYPLIAWDNTGFKLGIIYKPGKKIHIKIYDAGTASQKNYAIPESRFDRITGFTFTENDDEIIVSAIKNGQSDIYSMKYRGFRTKKITDDAWDDKDPVFVNGGARKGIIFLSNRPQPYINLQPLPNELPDNGMNAYFYNITTKSYTLLQLTHNKGGNIQDVIPYGQDNFAFLSNKSGINNQYLVLFARDIHNMDSAFTIPITNYDKSILYQNYNPAGQKVGEVIRYKKDYYVFYRPIHIPNITVAEKISPLPKPSLIGKHPHRKHSSKISETKPNASQSKETKKENMSVLPPQQQNIDLKSGEVFQSDFPSDNIGNKEASTTTISNKQEADKAKKEPISSSKLQKKDSVQKLAATHNKLRPKMKNGKHIRYVDSTFLKLRSYKYHLSFHPDFLSVRLDNNLIFNRYQSYSQNQGQYVNPSLAGMLMARLYDKMEDYRFTGGFRLPINFTGLAYFLQFENFRNRIDWGLIFYRQEKKHSYNFRLDNGSSLNLVQVPGKTISNILQSKISYPLNSVMGWHLYLSARQDKMILKAKDVYGLALPNVQNYWGMARLAFVSDNTREPTMNIRNGLRYKLYGETMYKFYSDNDMYKLSTDTNSFKKHSWIYNIGFDIRYYHKIYKNFIFAGRLAGAHSGGTQQILYFLGGEANSLHHPSNHNLPPSSNMDYGFQALATEVRGYKQNARNGNTYLLANLELRLPIITTFVHRPIKSSILKNLQAVAFLDLGNAWEGLLPTGKSLNRPYYFNWPPNAGNPTITLQIPNTEDQGIAVGYGLGLRTMLWGYFIRFDAALNKSNDFQWYLSFGTDF